MSRHRPGFDAAPDAVDRMLSGASALEHLQEIGDAAVWQLREAAPKRSERLSRSWTARATRDAQGRPILHVGTSSPYWHLANYGSANQPPTRFIDRAMGRLGVPWTPTPKGA